MELSLVGLFEVLRLSFVDLYWPPCCMMYFIPTAQQMRSRQVPFMFSEVVLLLLGSFLQGDQNFLIGLFQKDGSFRDSVEKHRPRGRFCSGMSVLPFA